MSVSCRTLRIIFAGTICVNVSSVVSALTSDWAYGAQLKKGDRQQMTLVRNYMRPRQNGNRVAFCMAATGTCGKPAADAFCRSNNFQEALTFQRDRMEGHSAQLRFLQIKCRRSKAPIAPKQIGASEVAGANVVSNAVAKSDRRPPRW
jgi:hypothetical protein